MATTSCDTTHLSPRLTPELRKQHVERASCDSAAWRAEAFASYTQVADELENVRAQTPKALKRIAASEQEPKGAKGKKNGSKPKGREGEADGPFDLPGPERERAIEIAERALDDALLAIVPPTRKGLLRGLKLFYSGACIELASSALHRARAALFTLYEPYELNAQAECLPVLVSALPDSSSVLKSLTGILSHIHTSPNQVALSMRAELREIYERTAASTEALQSEARILRNHMLTASAALLTGVVVLGTLHAVNTEIISVCTNATSSSKSYCPMGPGSERFDVFAVELAGMLGGLLSVAIPIATGERINTPYRVFNQQLVLKTFAGAATALAGVLLVQSGIISAFNVTSDSAILGFAVFFGVAQQAVTGAVDRRANSLAKLTPDVKPA